MCSPSVALVKWEQYTLRTETSSYGNVEAIIKLAALPALIRKWSDRRVINLCSWNVRTIIQQELPVRTVGLIWLKHTINVDPYHWAPFYLVLCKKIHPYCVLHKDVYFPLIAYCIPDVLLSTYFQRIVKKCYSMKFVLRIKFSCVDVVGRLSSIQWTGLFTNKVSHISCLLCSVVCG